MRRRVAAFGALLLLAAVFLYTNPLFENPISTGLGQAGQVAFLERNALIRVSPQNYSYFEAPLTTDDSIAVSLAANPGDVDVFLMNQGNFTLWAAGEQGSYSTYSEAALRISNYSFEFTNLAQSQDFFIVLVSHSTDVTSVLMQVVGTRPSPASLLLPPSVLGLVGILVLTYGLRSGRAQRRLRNGDALRAVSQPSAPTSAAESCRYCGTVLPPGSQFCVSCSRSQI